MTRKGGSTSALPTSALPSLRNPALHGTETVKAALQFLREACNPAAHIPLRRPPVCFVTGQATDDHLAGSKIDSGYVSNDDDDNVNIVNPLLDPLERNFTIKWLTTFLIRSEEISSISEDQRQEFVDGAATILCLLTRESLVAGNEDGGFERELTLPLAPELRDPGKPDTIVVRLKDAARSDADHTDVGLHSWGASTVIADMLCSAKPGPAHRFGLTPSVLGPAPRIVELGAGTGLISITLSKLLPRLGFSIQTAIMATDYHPAVLENLQDNISCNADPPRGQTSVVACPLDWARLRLEPPLDQPADVVIATDVVYAPEHAKLLRDCVAKLLAPHGVFWLVVSIRPNGKLEKLVDSVEVALSRPAAKDQQGKRLSVIEKEEIEKKIGVGRGDEVGYTLFAIRWVDV